MTITCTARCRRCPYPASGFTQTYLGLQTPAQRRTHLILCFRCGRTHKNTHQAWQDEVARTCANYTIDYLRRSDAPIAWHGVLDDGQSALLCDPHYDQSEPRPELPPEVAEAATAG